MPDMFQDSANWLSRASAWGSQLVSYVRDEEVLATFKAVPTITDETALDAAGNPYTVAGGEFAMDSADFTDEDEEPIQIEEGDTITMGTRTFDVFPPAPQRQPRPLDPHGVRIAIKVQEVAT